MSAHSAPRDPPSEAPLVADYLRDWLELQRTRLEPSTQRSYGGNVERYLIPHLGELRLDELTVPMLDRLYQELLLRGGYRGKPLSIRTVTYAHAVLRRALEDARRVGLVATNVSRDATLPRIDPHAADDGSSATMSVWTAEELRGFLASIAEHRLEPLFTIAAGTGARRGELLGLTWPDLDPKARRLRIHRALSVVNGRGRLKSTKTGRPRTIHLDTRTVEAFERQRAQQERARSSLGGRWSNPWQLVFTKEDGSFIDPYDVTIAFRRLVRSAPVPTIRLHALRHTHATLLLSEAGVPVKVVSERLGHASIQITLDRYASVLPSMDRDAAERFGEAVWEDGE